MEALLDLCKTRGSTLEQAASRLQRRLRVLPGTHKVERGGAPRVPKQHRRVGWRVHVEEHRRRAWELNGRQARLLVQETRDFDGQTGTSQSLRSKEMAHDYRYFPDPDLMPVKVNDAWKQKLRSECPELPFPKQRRFIESYQLPYSLTSALV